MKRILALLLSCCLLLTCVSALAEDTIFNTPLEAEASNGLTYVSGSAYALTDDYSSYINCYVYAEVRNDGASGIDLGGTMEAMDAAGNVLDTTYISAMPSYIAPGEVAYVSGSFFIAKMEDVTGPEDIASVKLTVGRDFYAYSGQISMVENVTAEMATGLNFLDMEQDVFRITINNDTDRELFNPHVVAAAYDTDGKLLCFAIETFILSAGIHIPAGSSLILDLTLPYDSARACEQNNVQITEVRCLVYTER